MSVIYLISRSYLSASPACAEVETNGLRNHQGHSMNFSTCNSQRTQATKERKKKRENEKEYGKHAESGNLLRNLHGRGPAFPR